MQNAKDEKRGETFAASISNRRFCAALLFIEIKVNR
jgi:hypothetical protein